MQRATRASLFWGATTVMGSVFEKVRAPPSSNVHEADIHSKERLNAACQAGGSSTSPSRPTTRNERPSAVRKPATFSRRRTLSEKASPPPRLTPAATTVRQCAPDEPSPEEVARSKV